MELSSIKKWLKEYDHSRNWLANELKVAPKTINNWLGSQRGVPSWGQIAIERLMEADRLGGERNKGIKHSLTLEFSSSEFDMIEKAAKMANKKIRIWATEALKDIVKKLDINISQD